MSKRAVLHICLSAFAQVSVLVVALMLAGCPPTGQTTPGPVPEKPLQVNGVPVIRVLVAGGMSLRVGTTGPYRVLVDGRQVASFNHAMPEGDLTRQGNTWNLPCGSYLGACVAIEPRIESWLLAREGSHVARSGVRIDNTTYRGWATFYTDPQRGIIAVNHVDLESYLAGVLAKELYSNWSLSTYQALAITARTYAMYEIYTTGRGHLFDLKDDQSSQMYGGFGAETDKTWRSVRATHGMVLAYGPAGHEKIFRAHYSSCCGGLTNNVYVLYGTFCGTGPMVGGQVCSDCQASTKFHWPAVAIPKDIIGRAVIKSYPNVDGASGVRTVAVAEELAGRAVWVDVVFMNGQKCRLRAEDLRIALLRDGDSRAKALYSMNCTIRDTGNDIVFDQGRGFGHGVGLCQWGAEGKAQRGFNANQIVAAYYPGSRIFKAY